MRKNKGKEKMGNKVLFLGVLMVASGLSMVVNVFVNPVTQLLPFLGLLLYGASGCVGLVVGYFCLQYWLKKR